MEIEFISVSQVDTFKIANEIKWILQIQNNILTLYIIDYDILITKECKSKSIALQITLS